MSEQRVNVWVQRFPDRRNLVLQWVNPDTGQRKSRTAGTDDPGEAEKRRADLEYELNHGKYQEASRMTWEHFRELFEAEYVTGLRPKTQEKHRATLDLFERLCHPAKVRSITERTVSKFTTAMRQLPRKKCTGLMPSTIRVNLEFLHTALQWAADQKLIPECPRFPLVKVPKKKPQPVPAESFEKLLGKAPDANLRTFLLCGWLAGLRLAEAITLEWEETEASPYLDLERNRIVLPAEFVKADEDQWLPLHPILREAVESLPRCGRKVFRFIAPDGHAIRQNAVSARVVRLAKQAGVRLTMRSLRRGFGCHFAGKVSAHVLQRLMRHSSIATTMTYYANVDAAVEEAVWNDQRNSLRNTLPSAASAKAAESDTTLLDTKSNGLRSF